MATFIIQLLCSLKSDTLSESLTLSWHISITGATTSVTARWPALSLSRGQQLFLFIYKGDISQLSLSSAFDYVYNPCTCLRSWLILHMLERQRAGKIDFFCASHTQKYTQHMDITSLKLLRDQHCLMGNNKCHCIWYLLVFVVLWVFNLMLK